jgi:hypothetical protein
MNRLSREGFTKLNYGTCLSITNTGIQHGVSAEICEYYKLMTEWSYTSTISFFLLELFRENFAFFYHFITSFIPRRYSLSMLSLGAIFSKIESVVK